MLCYSQNNWFVVLALHHQANYTLGKSGELAVKKLELQGLNYHPEQLLHFFCTLETLYVHHNSIMHARA